MNNNAYKEWVCPSCGKFLDRDFNAASNLRDWYLTHYNTAGTAEIYACGDSINTFGQRPNANAVIEAGKSVSNDGSPSL